MITEYFFPDRDTLFAELLKHCSEKLNLAIKQKNSACLLVSGGSTPQPLYQQLSAADLDWQNVHVALVDERWVDGNQAGSNEAFIKNNLLINSAAKAKYIAMKGPQATAQLGLADCERRYQALLAPYDLTILGMGSDGHTASLFPYAQGLSQALDQSTGNICVAINANKSDVTGELTERMSLSVFGLLMSQELILLITGQEKLAVYKQALASGDVNLTPVSALLQQDNVPINVFWAP